MYRCRCSVYGYNVSVYVALYPVVLLYFVVIGHKYANNKIAVMTYLMHLH